MNILDDVKKIKALDQNNVLGSINLLHKQCEQTWKDSGKIKIPASYKKVKNIVINGMGGSGLGAHIVDSLYSGELKIPLTVVNSYDLPGSVNQDTLYILSSYSGNTEEVLATFIEAKKRQAKIIGLACGGLLGHLLKENNFPVLKFNSEFNPCNSPRLGLGYSLFGLLGVLNKCQLIKVSAESVEEAIKFLTVADRNFNLEVPVVKNKAKRYAEALAGKMPQVVASEFLSGNAHVLANQFNESAKTFSSYFLISELNHHLLEGLSYPKANAQMLKFIFFYSHLYHPRNQARYEITEEVVAKNRIEYFEHRLSGKTKLAQVMEMLSLGSYISFYSAVLNGIEPSANPWVDYFKEKLAKV